MDEAAKEAVLRENTTDRYDQAMKEMYPGGHLAVSRERDSLARLSLAEQAIRAQQDVKRFTSETAARRILASFDPNKGKSSLTSSGKLSPRKGQLGIRISG